MSRRSGQGGTVVKKGRLWHVRFYVDVPGQEQRQRKSLPVGPCKGPDKLTKAEAARKGAEVVNSEGVNTEAHLERAVNGMTFRQRAQWCRENKPAWIEGKPGPVATMESQLTKHILPWFGDWPYDSLTQEQVQEFVSHLKKTTFELRRGEKLVKTYKLSRKTILNIVGVVKLVVGKKVWQSWEIELGKPEELNQPYFNSEQLQRIISAVDGQHRVLFALLAGTGMRIGEASGLYVDDLDLNNCVIYVRRGVWRGREQTTKSKKARTIDIDPSLAEMLRSHLSERLSGRVFASSTGSAINGNNILKRVLYPLLEKLGIPKAGLHAFRHSRVTMLRKNGAPEDLQKQWIGHSSLRTTDRYSHTDQEVEYRKSAASRVGLGFAVTGAVQ